MAQINKSVDQILSDRERHVVEALLEDVTGETIVLRVEGQTACLQVDLRTAQGLVLGRMATSESEMRVVIERNGDEITVFSIDTIVIRSIKKNLAKRHLRAVNNEFEI